MCIKVTAHDGVRFGTSKMEGSMGCYPPVDFKSREESFTEKIISTLLLKAAVRILEIKNAVFVYGAKTIVKLIAEFDGAKTEETNSDMLLSRTFRWDTPQAQANQSMVFYPIFPTHGGSFDVEYTMVGEVSRLPALRWSPVFFTLKIRTTHTGIRSEKIQSIYHSLPKYEGQHGFRNTKDCDEYSEDEYLFRLFFFFLTPTRTSVFYIDL